MISLKNIRDRVGQVEGYIKTTDANNYIANQGTVSSTNNLAGLPLTHYNCNGSCSWACSGSCSKGAGGGGGVSVSRPVRPIRTTRTYTKFLWFNLRFSVWEFKARFNLKENIVEIDNTIDKETPSNIGGFYSVQPNHDRTILAATDWGTVLRRSVNLLSDEERANLGYAEIANFQCFSSLDQGNAWMAQFPSEQNGWWGVIDFQRIRAISERNIQISVYFDLKIGLF